MTTWLCFFESVVKQHIIEGSHAGEGCSSHGTQEGERQKGAMVPDIFIRGMPPVTNFLPVGSTS